MSTPLLTTTAPNAERTSASDATRAALAIAPGVMLAGLAGGISFPIIPLIALDTHMAMPVLGVILVANRVARIVASPVLGAVIDRVGARRAFIGGLALQLVVMALYAEGVSLGRPGLFFLLARTIHGPSSACVGIAGQALALRAGDKQHGGRTGGIVRGAMMLGVPLGLVVGGVVADAFGIPATFGAAMIALAIAVVTAVLWLPGTPVTIRRDPAGRRVLMRARRELIAIGALSAVAFFAAHGVVMTMLPLLVNERAITLAGLAAKGTAGVLTGWMVVVMGVGSPLAGNLGDRRQLHPQVAALGVLALVPGLALAGVARGPLVLGAAVTLIGLGASALGPSLLASISALVPPDEQGAAIGFVQLCGDVGSLVGPLLGTSLIGLGVGVPYYASAAIAACFLAPALWLLQRARAARSAA